MKYKEYIGRVEFDDGAGIFHGEGINLRDVITFYGSSVAQLREEMQKSVEEYLEFCREQGREPEEPFSGEIVIQADPKLHRRVALEAAHHHVTMNSYIPGDIGKVGNGRINLPD